jgi:3-oxoacyl-[acyl-carrier protein] reductase
VLLENKNAIIYGAGGNVGGAVARAFARQGARVFLAGRTLAKLEEVAEEIRAAGGVAESAQVDALGKQAVNSYVASVAHKAGSRRMTNLARSGADRNSQPDDHIREETQ